VRLRGAISRWQRPTSGRAELEPYVALTELESWLSDSAQTRRGNRDDWMSLLDDVVAAWSAVGPTVHNGLPRLLDLVSEVTGVCGPEATWPRHGIAESERAMLESKVAALRAGLYQPQLLVAALQDAIDAVRRWPHATPPDSAVDDLEWQLAFLAALGDLQGHDWAVLGGRLSEALDIERTGDAERRLAVARRSLATPPDTGHSIVWMAFNHAWAWGLRGLEPTVRFFDADWLLQNLEHWEESDHRHEGIPAEIVEHRREALRAFHRVNPEMPVALARVDLDQGLTAGARDRARDTLRLLRDHASFEQGGSNWRLSDVCLHLVDGRVVYTASGVIGDPDAHHQLTRYDVTHNDPTLSTLNRDADLLRPKLPLTDPEAREALEMTSWLSDARLNPSPARLVLAQRILEQVAKWARRRPLQLVTEDLLWPWVWRQIEERLSRVGRVAVLRMPGHDGTTASVSDRERFLDLSRQILTHGSGGWPHAEPYAVLNRLGDLVEAHGSGGETLTHLQDLRRRLSCGRATLAWMDDLASVFARRRARAKRTRNVVVHGGPLTEPVARSIVGFQDMLASQALRWALEARLADQEVGVYIDARTHDYQAARERLGLDAAVSEALRCA
jgi:hypothetical protein